MAAAGATALIAIALAAPHEVLGASPATIVRPLEAADWRFDAVKTSRPPVDAVYDRPLELEDWREYGYDRGALRVYVSRDGRRIIALLGDTSLPPCEQLKELAPSQRYDVVTVGRVARPEHRRRSRDDREESVRRRTFSRRPSRGGRGGPRCEHSGHRDPSTRPGRASPSRGVLRLERHLARRRHGPLSGR